MKANSLVTICLAVCAFLFASNLARSAPGDEHWDTHFARPGIQNIAFALAVHDAKLYAAGFFAQPTGITNSQVDIWDGSKW